MATNRIKVRTVLKGLIVLVLLAVLAVIAVNFLSYSRKQPETVKAEKSVIPEGKEKKEKIEFTETEGVKESLRGTADEHFEGDDGLIHARGNVWLRYKEKYEFMAEEIIYDREQTHFFLEEKAKIRFGETVLEASAIEYDRSENAFRTDKQAVFSSERLSGSAGRIRYELESQELELDDGISLTFSPSLDTAYPLFVEGNSLTYSRESKKGRIEGGAELFHGKSRGSADAIGFELYANEEHVRFIHMEGNVDGVLVGESGAAGEWRVQADRISLQTFLDFFKVHSIEAYGHCRFQSVDPSGDSRTGESDFFKFVLSRTGQLREFHAIGKARLFDRQRVIEGDSLVIVEAVMGLQIKGSEEMTGRIRSGNFEISAEDILLDRDSNNLNATGKVKAVLGPNQEVKAAGFFSKESSVFVTADEMRYIDRERRYTFQGNTKGWQEKKMLTAEELTIDREAGKIYGSGGVTAAFPYTSKSSGEEVRVKVGGREMTVDPGQKMMSIQDLCSLRAGDVGLSSNSIRIDMEQEGEAMKNLVAEGNVTISQQQFVAKGKRAQFDMEMETIVLMGNAVFMDEGKGRIECDKLTFFLADDRIIVENQGQERSFSVIKS